MMDNQEVKRDRILKEALDLRVQLVAYARALLGNYAAAEDAVQEAMLVVVKKYDHFTEGTSMLAWCRSIVRLEVLRAKQKYQKNRSLVDRLLDDSIDAAFEEFQAEKDRDTEASWQAALSECLQRLNKRSQNALNARFVDGLSYEKISEKVGMKLEAVRKSLFRSKKQLRSCVETKMRGT